MHFIGDANIYNFKKTKAGCYENRFAPIFRYKDYVLEKIYLTSSKILFFYICNMRINNIISNTIIFVIFFVVFSDI